jgi:hypothetical protein
VAIGSFAYFMGFTMARQVPPRPMQGLIDRITAPLPPPRVGKFITSFDLVQGIEGAYRQGGHDLYTLDWGTFAVIELPADIRVDKFQRIVNDYMDHFIEAFAKEGIFLGTRSTLLVSAQGRPKQDGNYELIYTTDPFAYGESAYSNGNRIDIVAHVYDFDSTGQPVVVVGADSGRAVPAGGKRVLQLDIAVTATGFTETGKFPPPRANHPTTQPLSGS